MCKTGRCIRKGLRCDGWADCPDYSDERYCRESCRGLPSLSHLVPCPLLPPLTLSYPFLVQRPDLFLPWFCTIYPDEKTQAVRTCSHLCAPFTPPILPLETLASRRVSVSTDR